MILGRQLSLVAGLIVAVAALAGGTAAAPGLYVGATEDSVKSAVLSEATARLQLATAVGLNTLRITSLWSAGKTAPPEEELAVLRTTAEAASLAGVRLVVSLYPAENDQVPRDTAARAQFASFAASVAQALPSVRDFIVGNEPNKQFYWLPQYDGSGTSVAPADFVALLAETYDALKTVDPEITVIGGGISPRGNDNPDAVSNVSHSPGKFILRMGEAYRASGRERPIMDVLGFHPYGDSSRQPPSFAHPKTTTISIADLGKLVGFLARAFDGTAQPGSTLPIIYDEYGVQTGIPPERASLYTNADSPSATDVVDEATQAAYYREALELAFCQPNVIGILLFHTVDETDLGRWQSGLYYADTAAKTSLVSVAEAARRASRSVLEVCPGQGAPAGALNVAFLPQRDVEASHRSWRVRLRCFQDCLYSVALVRGSGIPALVAQGKSLGGTLRSVRLPARRVQPGSYRLELRLVVPLNPGKPYLAQSEPFSVG